MIKKPSTDKAPPKKTSKTSPKMLSPKRKTGASTKNKPEKAEPAVTILQTAKCQSLTNKSTLTYNIGVDDEGGIFIRVNGNTGGGFFSKEWVALEAIESVLGAMPDDHPISSFNLVPLFEGKSVNTPGYMMAVLAKEKLLFPLPGKKRYYAFSGTEAFLDKVEKLKAK